jgi:hypothetical protein
MPAQPKAPWQARDRLVRRQGNFVSGSAVSDRGPVRGLMRARKGVSVDS